MKTRRTDRSRCLLVAAFLGVLGAPTAARADGWYVSVEGGLNTMLTAPQSDQFSMGFAGSARLGLRVADPMSLHLVAGYWNWGARSGVIDPNTGVQTQGAGLSVFGAGLRLGPQFSPGLGRIYLDFDAGVGTTGSERIHRLVIGAGVGWNIPLGRALAMGPVVRYQQMIAVENEIADARFLTAGINIEFPGRPEDPPPPPPPPPPPVDTDRDGVMDPDDRCPAVPAGRHPDRVRRGCPENDRDGDDVPDVTDLCGDVPAGPQPDAARPGCPVPPPPSPPPACPACPACEACPAPAAPAPAPTPAPTAAPAPTPTPAATIVRGRIVISDSIYFDTSRATIQSRSYPILDAVVQVLRDHPEVSGLRVEGHTDDQGRARRNLTLSQDRAAAVVTYLVSHGVAGSRLSSAGFGATRPAVPGRSEEARAQPPRGLHHHGRPRRGAREPGARGALALALAFATPPTSLTPIGVFGSQA
jgi:outer membrane protein OmpA-like peptidoglycan-associated protein